MNIKGFQELTLKDWPGKMASIIFLGGCNLNCFYCHNSELAFNPERINNLPESLILKSLCEKIDWIDGVIISGGEPTIHGEKLKKLILKLKEIGFKVKLYTNGTNPVLLEELLRLSLIDAISIDIKHAPGKYDRLVDLKDDKMEEKIWTTVEIIKKSNIEIFFRTTIIKGIHSIEDIRIIKRIIQPYNLYLQNVQNKGVMEEYKNKIEPFSQKEFEEISCLL